MELPFGQLAVAGCRTMFHASASHDRRLCISRGIRNRQSSRAKLANCAAVSGEKLATEAYR